MLDSPQRVERLEEAIKVMKLLWSGDFMSFKGKYYKLQKANLYTRPASPIPIYIAASGPIVPELAGKYADGFLTIGIAEEQHQSVLVPALEKDARSGVAIRARSSRAWR